MRETDAVTDRMVEEITRVPRIVNVHYASPSIVSMV